MFPLHRQRFLMIRGICMLLPFVILQLITTLTSFFAVYLCSLQTINRWFLSITINRYSCPHSLLIKAPSPFYVVLMVTGMILFTITGTRNDQIVWMISDLSLPLLHFCIGLLLAFSLAKSTLEKKNVNSHGLTDSLHMYTLQSKYVRQHLHPSEYIDWNQACKDDGTCIIHMTHWYRQFGYLVMTNFSQSLPAVAFDIWRGRAAETLGNYHFLLF